MFQIQLDKPIVSVDWLNTNLSNDTIVVLDATIKKVTDSFSNHVIQKIPNTRYFDLKGNFSDTNSEFPTTIPSEKQFNKEAQKLGINTNSTIIIYDAKGIYSSARVWWLFKVFGFNNVAVLNGGLPEWLKNGFKTESIQNRSIESGNFNAHYQTGFIHYFKDIEKAIQSPKTIILDARSTDRFKSLVKEPRKGLRSGNIPSSLNLPYERLLNNGKLKSKKELQNILGKVYKKDSKFIVYCGSGITACIIALAAEICGYNNTSVYDGSWTEYGSLTT